MERREENGGAASFCSWTRPPLVPVLIAGVILIRRKSGSDWLMGKRTEQNTSFTPRPSYWLVPMAAKYRKKGLVQNRKSVLLIRNTPFLGEITPPLTLGDGCASPKQPLTASSAPSRTRALQHLPNIPLVFETFD